MAELVAIVVVFSVVVGLLSWHSSRSAKRAEPAGPPCPTCAAHLVQRGYVSWNGDAQTGVRVLTMGEAAPAQSFVARLQAAAASAPAPSAEGNVVRMVGALTLYACSGCQGHFVDQDGKGLQPCDAEQWRELGLTG